MPEVLGDPRLLCPLLVCCSRVGARALLDTLLGAFPSSRSCLALSCRQMTSQFCCGDRTRGWSCDGEEGLVSSYTSSTVAE